MAYFNFDVMLGDEFVATLEYEFIDGLTIPHETLRRFVIERKPLMRNKDFTIYPNGVFKKPKIKRRKEPLSIVKKKSFWKES